MEKLEDSKKNMIKIIQFVTMVITALCVFLGWTTFFGITKSFAEVQSGPVLTVVKKI
jgi:hypothetical protein